MHSSGILILNFISSICPVLAYNIIYLFCNQELPSQFTPLSLLTLDVYCKLIFFQKARRLHCQPLVQLIQVWFGSHTLSTLLI